MKVHILDDYFDTLRGLQCFAKLAGHDVTIWNDHCQEAGTLAKRLKDAEALVLFRERTKIEAALLDQLPNLKLISQRSVYPHIDVEACTRNGIMLCSNMHAGTPSYAAAEMTFALILASMRQIPQQMSSLQKGEWQMGVGRTVRGMTLGIWSYGRIGKAVAHYAKAFGLNVQVWGGDESCAEAIADGFTKAESREAFFATSDIISLHIRLKPTTKGVVTAHDLSLMKPNALLVNTSRSGLIEKGALENALAETSTLRAAVDVFDHEPLLDQSHTLLNNPNVIATPHIGYVTEEEFDLQFSDIFDQINAFSEGAPIHIINPDVLRT